VPDLKTIANNPDAALTVTAQTGQGLRVAVVYVLNLRGETLMPYAQKRAAIPPRC
jgi:hypothetical protein